MSDDCYGMVMVIYSALVRSHQSTYEGSFGLVRPASRVDKLHALSRASKCGGAHPTSPHDAHFVVPRAHAAHAEGVDVVLFGKPPLALG